jgi:hypothetical protein
MRAQGGGIVGREDTKTLEYFQCARSEGLAPGECSI